MHQEADTSYQSLSHGSASTLDTTLSIPRIPLNLRNHKTPLAITTTILVLFNFILPLCLYYILLDGAHTSQLVAITVSTCVFGAVSVVSMCQRLYLLLKKDSVYRPIGATKRHLDLFQIVYMVLFFSLTGLITAGSILPNNANPNIAKLALPIVSMGLPIVLVATCSMQVLIYITISLAPHTKYPFRMSSMAKGTVLRPAAYTIVEDVVAVDGKQGTEYRRMIDERYRFSKDIRALFLWADAAWGFSGVTVGVAALVIIWAVPNKNVGWVLAWVLPWVWAPTLTWLTIQKTKKVCRQENARYAATKEIAYVSE